MTRGKCFGWQWEFVLTRRPKLIHGKNKLPFKSGVCLRTIKLIYCPVVALALLMTDDVVYDSVKKMKF